MEYTTIPLIRRIRTPGGPSRLILQAGGLGACGKILFWAMGTPVHIIQMAKDLVRLSGKEPEKIAIVYMGISHPQRLAP
jgi:FlaA1/EpsC-like NDP-sugar epimerase